MPCAPPLKTEAWPNIPAYAHRKDSFTFCGWAYRQRSLVQRFFNELKQFRGITTRYDKNPLNFLAAVQIVDTRI
jgi:transposase